MSLPKCAVMINTVRLMVPTLTEDRHTLELRQGGVFEIAGVYQDQYDPEKKIVLLFVIPGAAPIPVDAKDVLIVNENR